MPTKFNQDAKDRVVRLAEDRILTENISMQAACKIVAPKLGVSWHTARQWTQAARREGRVVESMPEDLAAEKRKVASRKSRAARHQRVVESRLSFFASELDLKS
ncbi:hypothetical protein GCM10009604_01220 [Corynebacterium aurimucosum]|uniref:Putative transposase n=1 Tax=Corynebacterium aurimucosum (strain ATCC 700975 / DSM 44827 / CIP 107346 / CN-1) TaxID=548476 RepID=C3PL16_CORA7|nr:hypothetical protein [Corynebacterium aurimucosum]ACP32020.1 putative transposase [Corynebacterium aurimucosum ATCC 700975]WJY69589.1 hypothetical protein CAURIM_02250 [Corynebacterium aurimucosum]